MASKIIYRAVNPKNNKLLAEFPTITNPEIETLLNKSFDRYNWKQSRGEAAISGRSKKLEALKYILQKNKYRFADLIVNEMGKPRT